MHPPSPARDQKERGEIEPSRVSEISLAAHRHTRATKKIPPSPKLGQTPRKIAVSLTQSGRIGRIAQGKWKIFPEFFDPGHP